MPAAFSQKYKYIDAVKAMGRDSKKGLEAGAPHVHVPPCCSLTPLLKDFEALKLQAQLPALDPEPCVAARFTASCRDSQK